jgi:hypothetical protein
MEQTPVVGKRRGYVPDLFLQGFVISEVERERDEIERKQREKEQRDREERELREKNKNSDRKHHSSKSGADADDDSDIQNKPPPRFSSMYGVVVIAAALVVAGFFSLPSPCAKVFERVSARRGDHSVAVPLDSDRHQRQNRPPNPHVSRV